MKTLLTLVMIASLAVGNNIENSRNALMIIENEAGFVSGNVEIIDVGSDNAYLLGFSPVSSMNFICSSFLNTSFMHSRT